MSSRHKNAPPLCFYENTEISAESAPTAVCVRFHTNQCSTDAAQKPIDFLQVDGMPM